MLVFHIPEETRPESLANWLHFLAGENASRGKLKFNSACTISEEIKLTRGLFLENAEKSSHTKTHSKISLLMTSEVFYARILILKQRFSSYKEFQADSVLCVSMPIN